MHRKTMADVRETLGRTMEVVCGRGEISPRHKSKLTHLNGHLIKQILHDQHLPERSGVLVDVNDHVKLSAKAESILAEIDAELKVTLRAS